MTDYIILPDKEESLPDNIREINPDSKKSEIILFLHLHGSDLPVELSDEVLENTLIFSKVSNQCLNYDTCQYNLDSTSLQHANSAHVIDGLYKDLREKNMLISDAMIKLSKLYQEPSYDLTFETSSQRLNLTYDFKVQTKKHNSRVITEIQKKISNLKKYNNIIRKKISESEDDIEEVKNLKQILMTNLKELIELKQDLYSQIKRFKYETNETDKYHFATSLLFLNDRKYMSINKEHKHTYDSRTKIETNEIPEAIYKLDIRYPKNEEQKLLFEQNPFLEFKDEFTLSELITFVKDRYKFDYVTIFDNGCRCRYMQTSTFDKEESEEIFKKESERALERMEHFSELKLGGKTNIKKRTKRTNIKKRTNRTNRTKRTNIKKRTKRTNRKSKKN
jgi:hypothetical protein